MEVSFNTKDMKILHSQTSLTYHRFFHSQSLDRKEMLGGKYKVESITNICTQLSTPRKHNSSNKLYYTENSPSLQLSNSTSNHISSPVLTFYVAWPSPFSSLSPRYLIYHWDPLPRTGHWRAYDIARVSRYLLLLNLHWNKYLDIRTISYTLECEPCHVAVTNHLSL